MSNLLNDYSELIGGGGTPSERFLELAERIDSDRELCAVSADMRRSMMVPNLYSLIEEKAIGFGDLDGFSEGLVECLRHAVCAAATGAYRLIFCPGWMFLSLSAPPLAA